LLGSFMVVAPAQAGYYGDSYYGSNPCSYRCGYGYSPYRCSACGCYRRCHSILRPGLLYERRYVERQYVERRYGYGGYYRHHYGYPPYAGYRRPCGYDPCGGYRSWSRPYPWGDAGIGRRWPTPYTYRYEPSGYGYEPIADRYEEPPRPPAPVWDGAGAEPVPYGYESAQWNGD
jgi:hypothetical protein